MGETLESENYEDKDSRVTIHDVINLSLPFAQDELPESNKIWKKFKDLAIN